jgi:dolichol-phosphate mannosyltransferase
MDYVALVGALPPDGRAAVYGSRTRGQRQTGAGWARLGKHPDQNAGPWLANVILSFLILLLYGRWISDPLTAYKLYPCDLVRAMDVQTTGFESDHEMTAKLIRRGVPILEVPVSYRPRGVEEGKKIRARDGWIAVRTLVRFRCGPVGSPTTSGERSGRSL